ncbi:hypothetical protein N0V88_002642 [Collariella sp. IMI 366227]|nr:hypothetical protein N0V88_002642 [Collariella sp. IMI 366227]
MRDSNSLRLRLVVRRHSLPEVRVVFALQLDSDPTIANLLEQVNEILPLESDDWGLEDYAVQLRDSAGHGFDCLHFQPVSIVLKNDEEVFIRPLDTGDRRKRRLSGRDQISVDGRHLIDGIAFGRPRLRAPRDRPRIEIPPLKRRRIASDAEEDEEDAPRFLITEHGEDDRARPRVRIRAPFDDTDEDEDEENKDEFDGDFVEEDVDEDVDEDEEELLDELRDLEADNRETQGQTSADTGLSERPNRRSAQKDSNGLDLATLDKISALRATFPTVPADACERALASQNGSIGSTYLGLRMDHQPLMTLDAVVSRTNPLTPKSVAAEHDEDDESEAASVSSMVKHYDQRGFPSGSILAGTAAAHLVETMRKSGYSVKAPVYIKFDHDIAQGGHSSPSMTDEGSSEQHESDDHSGGYSEGQGDAESDGDDSGDDSDSGPEVASSKRREDAILARLLQKAPTITEDDSDSGSSSEEESESASEAETSSDSDSDDNDDDSDGANDLGSHDDGKYGVEEHMNSASGPESGSSDDDSTSGYESEESDSFSVASSSDDNASETPSAHQGWNSDTAKIQPPASHGSSVQGHHTNGACQVPPAPVPPGQGKTTTQKRNARRRAALKALKASATGEGLTAVDSQQTIAAKKELLLQRLSFLQPTPPPPTASTSSRDPAEILTSAQCSTTNSPPNTPPYGSPDSWQKKIIYRGVECCHHGVELSEPPFPFVQRWDPQQQYFRGDKNQCGGRSKRKERNQLEFVDQGSRLSAKRRRYAGDSLGYEADEDDTTQSYFNYGGDSGFADTVLNYDDVPEQTTALGQEGPSQTLDEDDLPPLPTDMSTLPSFQSGMAQPGMVLTWKQILLSKTSWQPQVFALTGIVVDVFDEGMLTVRLAKRDRNLDQNEKVYDDEGNRVYDKFELPGMDDESEEESTAQGYRTLELVDMVEPRILRPAPGVAEGSHSAQQQPGFEQYHKHQQGPGPSKSRVLSTTPEQPGMEAESPMVPHGMDIDTQPGVKSITSETSVLQEPDESMSEDRRHEISMHIKDAGFRKGIDPSVTENACLDLSSPSQQLNEAYVITLASSELLQPQSRGTSSPEPPSQGTPKYIDSRPILLEPFHGFSDPVSEPYGERGITYPKLDLLSSETGSLHSVRQIGSDFRIELGNDTFHGLDDGPAAAGSIPEDEGDHDQDGPVGSDGVDHSSDDASDSDSSNASFPSLSEVWITASTSSSKSPSQKGVMAAITARRSHVSEDLEYHEVIRRLDSSNGTSEVEAADTSEDDTDNSESDAEGDAENRFPQQVSTLAHKLVNKPIEKPIPKKQIHGVKMERGFSNAAKQRSRAISPKSEKSARSFESSFVPPEGSQVVSLLTSSPEPVLEEHYAEDSIDETYKKSSMPTGSGWVKKSRAQRSVSVPASSTARDAAPKRVTSSQSRATGNADKRSASAMSSLLRAKKKVSGNMV